MSQRLDQRLSRKETRRLDEHLAECVELRATRADTGTAAQGVQRAWRCYRCRSGSLSSRTCRPRPPLASRRSAGPRPRWQLDGCGNGHNRDGRGRRRGQRDTGGVAVGGSLIGGRGREGRRRPRRRRARHRRGVPGHEARSRHLGQRRAGSRQAAERCQGSVRERDAKSADKRVGRPLRVRGRERADHDVGGRHGSVRRPRCRRARTGPSRPGRSRRQAVRSRRRRKPVARTGRGRRRRGPKTPSTPGNDGPAGNEPQAPGTTPEHAAARQGPRERSRAVAAGASDDLVERAADDLDVEPGHERRPEVKEAEEAEEEGHAVGPKGKKDSPAQAQGNPPKASDQPQERNPNAPAKPDDGPVANGNGEGRSRPPPTPHRPCRCRRRPRRPSPALLPPTVARPRPPRPTPETLATARAAETTRSRPAQRSRELPSAGSFTLRLDLLSAR